MEKGVLSAREADRVFRFLTGVPGFRQMSTQDGPGVFVFSPSGWGHNPADRVG